MTAFDPEAELEKLGISIQYLQLQDILAAWDAERSAVYCSVDLRPVHKRGALCHELAHITLGHQRCAHFDDSVTALETVTQERAAEMWAARQLISTVELAIAQESGLSCTTIAREFGVTERMYRARLLAHTEDERRWLGGTVST
ncbi:ImmA/IrrE family metallo-endopeptidase [Streptomyces sp. WZ-12]|uniref:ImmA/IrrE family metallo-endopeptidase n=1 Tax=Streptomyces sp. WZ-12 TaxID=3030210 RepID=UPI00406C7C54